MAATLPASPRFRTPFEADNDMESAPGGGPPPRRAHVPWADAVFALPPRAPPWLTLASAGRHHRVAGDRRLARRSRVRPVLPVAQRLGPGPEPVRRPGDDLRHADDVGHRAADRGAGELRHRDLPDRAVPRLAEAPAGHGHRTAGRGAVDRLRHVGPARLRPHPGHLRAAAAAGGVSAACRCWARCCPARRWASASCRPASSWRSWSSRSSPR